MSTVRRSKAMPTDGPTVKFLYTIIKQLDLKSIDWSLVASQLEISNGHAARMRYSRFRQQMEGTTSTPRSSRPKKTSNKAKTSSSKAELLKESISSDPQPVAKQEARASSYEPVPYIKTDPNAPRFHTLADIPSATCHMMQGSPAQPSTVLYPQLTISPADLTRYTAAPSFLGPTIGFEHQPNPTHLWSSVKTEPEDNGGMCDIFIKEEEPLEQASDSKSSGVEFYGMLVPGLDMAMEPLD
ncbi:hypothetical protein BBP40_005221 [Aspergillus hancockii]|nr:hypothetical protein BBP40_005221 [Aspergillus hancockii]